MNEKKLLNKIEKIRKEINIIASKKGFLDKEVLKKSQQLDELLNKHNKITSKKQCLCK